MTGIDPHRAFLAALPERARRQLHVTAAVVAAVHAAITNHGWTPDQLAAECSRNLADVVNAGAVITERLRIAATHPPTTPAAARRVHFGCCDNGWIYDESGDEPRAVKCPGNAPTGPPPPPEPPPTLEPAEAP